MSSLRKNSEKLIGDIDGMRISGYNLFLKDKNPDAGRKKSKKMVRLRKSVRRSRKPKMVLKCKVKSKSKSRKMRKSMKRRSKSKSRSRRRSKKDGGGKVTVPQPQAPRK